MAGAARQWHTRISVTGPNSGGKTRILRNVISDKLGEEGKTVAIGACVYYKDCALRVDSMREGVVTRVEVIKNL